MAHDAYRLSRSGCTCPMILKVCSLQNVQLRTGTQWLTFVWTHSAPEFSSSVSSVSFFLSGRHTQRAACYTLGGVIQGDTLLLLSSCALVLTDVSLPPLPLCPPLTLFYTFHLCPSPSSLSSCGFCFFPSGVQMTLLVIAVKPTLWPVSTVCQFPLLSLCRTVLCVAHACRRRNSDFLLNSNSVYVCVCVHILPYWLRHCAY